MFTEYSLVDQLGIELLRPDSMFVSKYVVQPTVVWDASAQPGKTVILERYDYWDDDSFTIENRRRAPTQTIGTANSRDLSKTRTTVTIDEYTGPSGGDPTNPNAPGNFKIPMEAVLFAQRPFWEYSPQQIQQFHQSIGSITLLRDFRKWSDRAYIQKLLETTYTYNPQGVVDGGTYSNGPPKVDFLNDVKSVVTAMQKRNVPPFSSEFGPVYHALVDPIFYKHLEQDPDFRSTARHSGAVPLELLMPGATPYSAPLMPSVTAGRNMGAGMGPIPSYINHPNQLIFGGSLYNQSSFGAGDVMPTGVIYEGVRWFVTNNLPTQSVSLNYTATTDGSATGLAARTGYLGIVFGQQAVGEAVAGKVPVTVRLNNNDDFQRFVIAIWDYFGGFSLLNDKFVTVMRSYAA